MTRVFTGGRQLDWQMTVAEVLERWPADRRVMLLYSGRYHPRWARWSILGQPCGTWRVTIDPAANRDGPLALRSRWTGATDVIDPAVFTHRPYRDLRHVQKATDALWIGYLGYDLGRAGERMPAHRNIDRGFPVVEFACCRDYLMHDTCTGIWQAFGDWASAPVPDLAAATAPDHQALQPAAATVSAVTRAQYEKAVGRVVEYIAAGDVFQVNLAQRLTAQLSGRFPAAPRAVFSRLAEVSPAWYGAYLELNDQPLAAGDAAPPPRAVASISPELFLEVDPAGHVITRPIKGTRPASADVEELQRSVKDQAELTMIVDLLRNDLGRVCDYGSVRVTDPRSIETHPTVHHGVATVEGRLHPSKDLASLLRATMPGGSITGAPKIRAMQIIDELEPAARGPYCGAIGLFTRDRACFNIAIRTMMLEQTAADAIRADFAVGGGIIADSDPAAEYQETLDKAAAMLKALTARQTLTA
jgi:para-aminobenzoate synthetase component 1